MVKTMLAFIAAGLMQILVIGLTDLSISSTLLPESITFIRGMVLSMGITSTKAATVALIFLYWPEWIGGFIGALVCAKYNSNHIFMAVMTGSFVYHITRYAIVIGIVKSPSTANLVGIITLNHAFVMLILLACTYAGFSLGSRNNCSASR